MSAQLVPVEEKRKWISEAGPRQTKQFSKAMGELSREHNMFTDLSGVIGGEERSYTYWSPFGRACRADVAQVQKQIAEQFDYTVTAKNHKQIIAAIDAALPALQDNRPVNDKRRTPDEVTEQERERAARQAKFDEENRIQAQEEARLTAELREKYPWARQEDKLSRQARAAANLRIELAMNFPGVRFTVKSDSASMTTSVDYGWDMGPTGDEVRKVADKYAYGRFDGMTDYASEDNSAYGAAVEKVLGRARYCQGSRHIPEAVRNEIERLLCEAQQVDLADCKAGRVRLYGQGDSHWLDNHVNILLSRTTFPLGAEITGIAHSNGGYDEMTGENRESGYYLTFSEPIAPPVSAESAISASGVVVKENEARGGIEIHFPAKPAQSILDQLHDRANGAWKYSMRQPNVTGGRGIWYAKASEQTRTFAHQIAA